MILCSKYFVFFYKQKTAYEMRISDWSSDVCSSDLDLLFHRVQRIQRSHRFLEDHRDLVATHVAQQPRVGADELPVLEGDGAAPRMLRHRVGQELHDRQCRHRLAGAALADQRHGFALDDIEAHVLHRVDGAARYAEADAKKIGSANV